MGLFDTKPIIYAEIADNPESLSKGLMFRKKLSFNSGMLFKFSSPRKLRFWGKNTYIPLDIAYVSDSNEIMQISKIDPLSEKTVCSECECLMAIEANAGFFEENKIKVGYTVSIQNDSVGGCCISFDQKNKGK